MSNGNTNTFSASISNGNTYIELPDWNPLNFNQITSGSGAGIVGGALVFAADGDADIALSISLVVLSGGPIDVSVGYAWDGAPVTSLVTVPVAGQVNGVGGTISGPVGESLRLFVSTDDGSVGLNWTQGVVNVTQEVVIDPSDPAFPAFTPILPPPPVGVPPPPTFPPTGSNTAPVPVPVGPLADPIAIAPAGVPPSVAGVPQPQFQPPGSATVPPANGYFPQFTTNPPSPPIVITQSPGVFGIFMNAGVADQIPPWGTPPLYIVQPPPSTPTTAPFPPLPTSAMESASARTVHSGHSRPPKRRGRSVLSASNNHAEH